MNRSSIALFLSTLALAGGTVACGQTPDAGEKGGSDSQELQSPNQPKDRQAENGGEGGEGGEG